MHLLNTRTFQLKEFFDTDIPAYGILSHTWGPDEFTFKDLQSKEYKGGIKKIDGACEVARDQDLDWIWIDTCCIDKSSSAELSEAINSMFAWYKQAAACYIYLEDVTQYQDRRLENISSSRWFTRGWTLQELLAASRVYFYDRSWNCIRQIWKSDVERPFSEAFEFISFAQSDAQYNRRIKFNETQERFIRFLSDLTKIDELALSTKFEAVNHRFSVAKKMSWAAERRTTRVEDRAYSLIGLFDVNMPLLYGEGEKAFFRLQEEIIRKTNDESLFSWGFREPPRSVGGLFARSPSDFGGCGNVLSRATTDGAHYFLTNRGLRFQARLSRSNPIFGPFSYAMINCTASSCLTDSSLHQRSQLIAIPLYNAGGVIIRPAGSVPILLDAEDFDTQATSIYIHISRTLDDFESVFGERGSILVQLEKSSLIRINLNPGSEKVTVSEIYPPSWYPLYFDSKPLTLVQDIESPKTSDTVWMRFQHLVSERSSCDVALRLRLEWSLVPWQISDRLGLVLESVKSHVKLIPQNFSLFQDILRGGDRDWNEMITWGGGKLSVTWDKGELEPHIRLNVEGAFQMEIPHVLELHEGVWRPPRQEYDQGPH